MKRLLLASVSLLISTSANAQISSTGSVGPVTFGTPFNTDFTLPSPTPFIIGDTGDGELSVEGGLTLTADRFDIGSGGFGTLNVSGAGSLVDALGRIDMGLGAGAEINITNGGQVTTNTINFGMSADARINVEGAGSHLQVNTDLTYGTTSFAEARITNNATADIFNLNILSTGANAINFLIDDASVTTDGTFVNATNANLTLANNASLTAYTNLVLQKGVIRVTDGSTLSTTANNFMATGGQLFLEGNSSLSTVNAELAGDVHINNSSWINSGDALVLGNFNLVNSTASTNVLRFFEGFYNPNLNVITLDNSDWNVATSTIFETDNTTGGVAVILNNQSSLNTPDFITGAEGGFARINVNSGSKINADNVTVNQTGPYFTTATTHIKVDGTDSEFNVVNDIIVDPDSLFSFTLLNGGSLNIGGDLILNNNGVAGSSSDIIIGAAEGQAAQDAGAINVGGQIDLGNNTQIIFNHTDNNYIFDNAVASALHYGGLHFLSGTTTIANDYSGFQGSISAVGDSIVHLGAAGPLNPNASIEASDNATLYLYGPAQTVHTGVVYSDFIMGTNTNQTLTITAGLFGRPTNDPDGYGTIHMEAALAGDSSLGDRIILDDMSLGEFNIKLTNRHGPGAQTADGIKLITATADSMAQFNLLGDITYNGQEVVIAGAYAYALSQGTLDGTTDPHSWFLRSSLNPIVPAGPFSPQAVTIYSPIASVLEAYPQALQSLNQPDDLDKRLANYTHSNNEDKYGVWIYNDAQHTAIDPRHSTTDTSYKTNSYEMRGGVDIPVFKANSGDLVAGLGGRYINGRTATKHNDDYLGQGKIKSTGYGVIPSLTWYGNNGFYVDGISQATWYKSDLNSKKLNSSIAHNNDAFGYAVSTEIGKSFPLTSEFDFSLQGQLIYSHIKYDGFIDELDTARIKNGHANALTGRLGSALTHTTHTDMSGNRFYAKLDLFNDFKNSSKTTISELNNQNPESFKSERERVWAGLSLGGTHSWAGGKYNIHGEVGATSAFKHVSDNHSVGGSVGFTIKF